MLEAIAESVVMLVPQAIGWGALKLLTSDDIEALANEMLFLKGASVSR